MKAFNIETTREGFFLKYLLILQGILPMRFTAMRVFAAILYWNDLYKDLPPLERTSLIFSKDVRIKLLDMADMSRASFDNQLTYLRNKDFLLGNRVNPKYEIFYNTHKDLVFSFKIKEDD